MTNFYGDDPVVLIEEVKAVWPELLDMDVAPLADWSTTQQKLPEQILDGIIGGSPGAREEVFQGDVLGDSLDAYLESRLGDRTEQERRTMRAQCLGILEGVRPSRRALDEEWSQLVRAKLALGNFDRWPYVTLTKRRSHTQRSRGQLLYSYCGAIGDSCWVVGFDVYEGEAPSYEAARSAWESSARACREEIESLLIQ